MQVGQRVELIDKKLLGTIMFIGETEFASGKWIGVKLDEPKGKNNGSVQGKQYFSCPDNCGLFVRQTQIRLKSTASERGSTASLTGSGLKPPSTSSSTHSLQSTSGDTGGPSSSTPSAQTQTSIPSPSVTSKMKPPTTLAFSGIRRESAIPSPSVVAATTPSTDQPELHAEIKDLKERLETLILKRKDDKLKLMEFEKTKIQLMQLQEFKKSMTESHSELQKQLSLAKKEAKEAVEEKSRIQEETRDLEEAAELATLDKEMAEEKFEQTLRELEATKEKLEEVTLDLDIIKGEIDAARDSGVAGSTNDGLILASGVTSYEVKQLESKNEKLTEALLKLRDISNEDKAVISKISKELETYKNTCSDLQKVKDKLSSDIQSLEEQVIDLKEQVDAGLGNERMVELLTDKNLRLEEEMEKMIEDKDVLEKLLETTEQLLESARETELQMIQEKDMMQSHINQLVLERENSGTVIQDYVATIDKFRDLVSKLKDENDTLKSASHESAAQVQRSLAQEAEHNVENVEYKIRFSEQKAKDLEEEIKKLEESLTKAQAEVTVKQEEIKGLTQQIDEQKARIEVKDLETSQLKKALKAKIDEASEANIRREMADKKLSNASKDSEERANKLEKELNDYKMWMQNKEMEYEETMNHLENDIANLEEQKLELKERLKSYTGSGKGIVSGSTSLLDSSLLSQSSIAGNSSTVKSGLFNRLSSMSPSSVASHGNLDLYASQISSLQRALHRLRTENYSLRMEKAVKAMNLKDRSHVKQHMLSRPLWLLKLTNQENELDRKRERLNEIKAKIESLNRQTRRFMVNETLFDFSSLDYSIKRRNEVLAKEKIITQYRVVQKEVMQFMDDYSDDLMIQSQLKSFVTPSLTKVMQERESMTDAAPFTAKIVLPAFTSMTSTPSKDNQTVSLEVSWNQLRSLHSKLL